MTGEIEKLSKRRAPYLRKERKAAQALCEDLMLEEQELRATKRQAVRARRKRQANRAAGEVLLSRIGSRYDEI